MGDTKRADPGPINRSPVIVVPENMAIGECVKRMKSQKVGAVLVVSATPTLTSRTSMPGEGEILGIFTERDLLQKIDLIQSWPQWDRPVRTIMSAPVVTLKVSELHRAPRLMLQRGFRHVPIVHEAEGGIRTLLGVLSMRDLLYSYWERKGDLSEAEASMSFFSKDRKTRANLGIVSADPGIQQLLSRALSDYPKIQAHPMAITDLIERIPSPEAGFPTQLTAAARKLRAIVLDLDSIPTARWTSLLKLLNHEEVSPWTLIVFDSVRYPSSAVKTLEKLGNGRRFSVFSKPLSPIEFFRELERRLYSR